MIKTILKNIVMFVFKDEDLKDLIFHILIYLSKLSTNKIDDEIIKLLNDKFNQ